MRAVKEKKIDTFLLSLLLFLPVATSFAQDSAKKETSYTISAFFDIYYVYDFGKPEAGIRQPFLYNHNRHNELSLNLGFIKANAVNEKYRGNLALMGGTYVNDNYAQEPELFKRIFEFNAGYSLNKKNNLWLDAGIFASHLGFESAVSKENITLTRSLLAENSPYYLAGGKLTYKPIDKWEFVFLLCNGWQRIRPVQGNTLPALGTQIKHTRKKLTYNWSTFAGTDDPDSLRRMRYFNNFFLLSTFDNGFDFVAGFDIGVQQQRKGSSEYHTWFSPVIIFRYQFSKLWASALRFENYNDRNGVMVNHVPSFIANSVSLNIDLHASKNVLCRIEGRLFVSQDKIFRTQNIFSNKSSIIAASVAVAL